MADIVEQKAVILVKEETDNVAHPIFFGTVDQCKSIMFHAILPSENRKNIVNHDSDWGYWVSYERLKGGEMKKIEMFLQLMTLHWWIGLLCKSGCYN